MGVIDSVISNLVGIFKLELYNLKLSSCHETVRTSASGPGWPLRAIASAQDDLIISIFWWIRGLPRGWTELTGSDVAGKWLG